MRCTAEHDGVGSNLCGHAIRDSIRSNPPRPMRTLSRQLNRLLLSPRAMASRPIHLANTMEEYHASPDQRIFAPAAARNKQPICDVLSRYLPAPPHDINCSVSGTTALLEVACGTGEHSAFLAAALPHLSVQPTDCTPEIFGSVAAHALGLPNVSAPLLLDAAAFAEQWPPTSRTAEGEEEEASSTTSAGSAVLQRATVVEPQLDAVLCINMTHISPYEATLGLLKGAGKQGAHPPATHIYGRGEH